MVQRLNTKWLIGAVLACGVLADIAWSSFTRPFRLSGDVVTSGGIVLVFAVVGAQLLHAQVPAVLSRRATGRGSQSRSRWRWGPWVLVSALVTTFELINVFSLPRAAHPTLSSILDLVDSHSVGKTLAFAAWLALGWFFVTR